MATPEILEKIMSEINDILPASEAGLAEEIEPVIKKYLEYGELKQSPRDPFIEKHLGRIWDKLVEARIELCIKPMFDSLEAASIKHFLETGTINGSFRARLVEMMNGCKKWGGEAKQSPRWVKASERLPEAGEITFARIEGHLACMIQVSINTGKIHFAGVTKETGYDYDKILWLDESGSPEPEAVDPDFTLWVVVNKWQYHEGKHRWLNDYIAECNGMRLTHEELYNLFKQTK